MKSVLRAVVSVAATVAVVETTAVAAMVAVAAGINLCIIPVLHITFPLFGSPSMNLHFNPGSMPGFFFFITAGFYSIITGTAIAYPFQLRRFNAVPCLNPQQLALLLHVY